MAALPDDNPIKFGLNSNCIKIGNDVFCMPDKSDCIWVYDAVNSEFSRIIIANLDNVCSLYVDAWQYGDRMFTFSGGLTQIIESDIKAKIINGYYVITEPSDYGD